MSPARLLACLPLLAPVGETHVDATHGLRVEIPEGWSPVEQDLPEGFTLFLVPPGEDGRTLLAFSVRALAAGEGVEALETRALAKVQADASFTGLERLRLERAGAERPALRVRKASPLGELELEAWFLVGEGRGYVVQRAAPAGQLERWAPEYARIEAGFAPLAPDPESLRRERLAELAARCGEEVDWAPSWEEAARRARELGRPVLAVAWLYGAFRLPSTPRTTIFMDPDVLELVATRFVPWWVSPGEAGAFRERYGLSSTSFGQGLLVVSPEGEVRAQCARATDADLAHAFLRRSLGESPGAAPAPDEPDALGQARGFLARGALEAARARLAEARTAEEQLLLARIERLAREGPAALEALQRARALAPDSDPAFGRALELEQARLDLRLGRRDELRATCERLLADAQAPVATSAEAALLLGLAELQEGEREAARARWNALVDEHPESRWAWQAAALLTGGLLELELPLDLAFPDEALLIEELRPDVPAPLPGERALEARDAALSWLLAGQRADGSWSSPSELTHSAERGPNPFVDATTALALRALARYADRPGPRSACERALAFLLASVASRARTPTVVLYMDYTPWSDAALIEAFCAALEAGLGEPEALRRAAGKVLADLAGRAQPHGGWGYYVTSDLEKAAAPPTSMSFTTAACVLALARARAAGLPGDGGVAGADSLAAMRDAQGRFAYSLGPGGPAGVPPGMEPGAAGRAPVCELALLRAGASDAARVRRALEQFLRHALALDAERGKVLMHAGPAAQGCHYVLFDHAWAAAAWRAIDGDEKTRLRLAELLLACRQSDGSFLDTPINGRACGTALALLALDDLAR